MELTLSHFLPYRLNRISEAVSNEMRAIYKQRHGLNRPEWRVLAALADLERSTATEVGAHSTQHKTKVSRAVFALEKRRWLKRQTDPQDRRSEYLTLTDAGRKAYRELAAPLLAREERILARLSDQDRNAVEQALSALETALDITPDGAPPDAPA
ncbi:MAG: MarR family transcriptional regulator [Nitratireductor sp.]|nr:MarR family transcriptional regulator [Nitratireductor sp.]